MLLLLHNAGFDVNAKDSSGMTALGKAAEAQNKAKMKALLDLGADPNIATDYGRRPLDTVMDNYTYTYTDHKDLIAMLLAKGADPGLSPHPVMPYAPLHLAARQGKVEDMKMLLAKNVPIDQNARTPDGMTPFLLACESGKHDAALFLQSQGADVFKKDNFGRGALQFAARGGSEKAIDALLAVPGMETHLDDQDQRGRTATHDAFRKYHNDTGVYLIKKGAKLDVYDKDGYTPLHQAIITSYMSDFLNGVKDALGDKADWNLKTKNGDTLLIVAARHNQAPVVEKLLELGADPAMAGAKGVLPLHQSLMTDNDSIIRRLVAVMKEKNIAPDTNRDVNGWGATHYAAVKDNAMFLQLMLDQGGDVNAKSNDGDTPLHLAARAGKLSSANTLLARGADALAQNKNGQTALDIAMEMKRADIAQAVMIAAAQQKAAAAGVEAPGFNKWKPLGTKPGAPTP
jgi:ankyrin repeat protein